jgi:hypothetical protein
MVGVEHYTETGQTCTFVVVLVGISSVAYLHNKINCISLLDWLSLSWCIQYYSEVHAVLYCAIWSLGCCYIVL